MRKAVCILLSISFGMLLLPSAFGAARPRVGVIEFSATGAAAVDASAVTELFRIELVNCKYFDVLERANMDRIMKEQEFQQTGCTETACAVKLGKVLNAEYMIYGSTIRLGAAYFITASMVNIETGQIEKTGQVRADRLEDVQKPIIELVRTLMRESRRVEYIEESKTGRAAYGNSGPPVQTQPLGLFEDIVIHAGYSFPGGNMWQFGYTTQTFEYGVEYTGRNVVQPIVRLSGYGPYGAEYSFHGGGESAIFGTAIAGIRLQPVLFNSIAMFLLGGGIGGTVIIEPKSYRSGSFAVTASPVFYGEGGIQFAVTRGIFFHIAYDVSFIPLATTSFPLVLNGIRLSFALPYRFTLLEYPDKI